jgi:hypothetical protein
VDRSRDERRARRVGRDRRWSRPARSWRRTAIHAGLLLLATALLLAGCSSADMDRFDPAIDAVDGAEQGSSDQEFDAAADEGDGPAVEPEDAAEGEATTAPVAATTTGRRVIRTAELVLEVEDPAEAATLVVAIATDAGGFVATTDLARDAEGVVRGTIVLRVPSETLLATVEALDALAAAVPVNRIDEVDVTAEATDLQARLTNLTTYERELRELLGDVRETTTRPDDLLTVFERIRSVRQEIDTIEARLAVLDDQVALATITVELQPTARALPVTDPTWQPGDTARSALTSLARTLAGLADSLIWLTLAVLPVLLLAALPIVLLWLAYRAYRRRHPGQPRPTAPPSWSAPHPPTPTPPTAQPTSTPPAAQPSPAAQPTPPPGGSDTPARPEGS